VVPRFRLGRVTLTPEEPAGEDHELLLAPLQTLCNHLAATTSPCASAPEASSFAPPHEGGSNATADAFNRWYFSKSAGSSAGGDQGTPRVLMRLRSFKTRPPATAPAPSLVVAGEEATGSGQDWDAPRCLRALVQLGRRAFARSHCPEWEAAGVPKDECCRRVEVLLKLKQQPRPQPTEDVTAAVVTTCEGLFARIAASDPDAAAALLKQGGVLVAADGEHPAVGLGWEQEDPGSLCTSTYLAFLLIAVSPLSLCQTSKTALWCTALSPSARSSISSAARACLAAHQHRSPVASGAAGFLRTLVFGGTGGPLGSSGVAEAGVEVSFAALKLERSVEMGKV
jgi:hypothetical protein